MPERQVDMAAVSRVSRRVELQEVRLVSFVANGEPGHAGQALEADYTDACAPTLIDASRLEVSCGYTFTVKSAGAQVAELRFIYLLGYRVLGEGQPAEDDVAQFALANGPFHSWPFAREIVYGMTSRMGFPAFVLPVLTIKGKPPSQSQVPASADNPVHPE